jgi:hypothetical protein
MIRIVLHHDRKGYIGSYDVNNEALHDDDLWSIVSANLRRHCLLIVDEEKPPVIDDDKRNYYD